MDGNYYFTDEEYDIFAEEYQDKRNQYLETIRKEVQAKLLQLNVEILKEIAKNGLRLYNHPNPKNTTSLIVPIWYNKGKVNWLGVRYGKNPNVVKELNFLYRVQGEKSDDSLAFQKHACMQINVGYNGVEIGIFHAVPNGAIDRDYLHEHIDKDDNVLVNAIREEIKNLIGYGYEWNIWDTNLEGVELPNYGGANLPEKVFKFNNENKDDFIKWYSDNDRNGCYSSMLVHFPRYDERVNANNILNTTIRIFKQLYPLYKLISWDIEGDKKDEK